MSELKLLWQPSEEFKSHSNLKQYEEWLMAKKNLEFGSYEELWRWSVTHLEVFWESLWHYFGIHSHTPYHSVLKGSEMPGYQWFEGSTLNYAEHIFRNRSDEDIAIIAYSEEGATRRLTWAELKEKVAIIRNHFDYLGVKKGDRVVAYLPNIPEATIAFLAANSLGAIWSCCSPDFGVSTVVDRFTQIEPKLLIAGNGYSYNGKFFDKSQEIKEIEKALTTLEQTILIPIKENDEELPEVRNWTSIIERGNQSSLVFTPVPFDHPIWVLYSSGTTGKPKAITHSHGGVLLEHHKYMAFHNDVHPGEHFFWFTTTGWMMWNFLQSSLLMGATAILFDGSPGYHGLNTLWKVAEELPIHHFGTSAPFLTACMKRGLQPGKDLDLSTLRSIGSTGAPLPPEAFEWVYEAISRNVWLCSMSGGTDVCTAFVGGSPYKPVFKGAIQSRALGCDLIAANDKGEEMIGSLGEMVIRQPMPSMPIYFWNDPGNQRYRSSYFDKYSTKWCHGDWVKIFDDGSLIIQGRSDATLNRKGIRIGTAEIYSALNEISEIEDSLVVNLEKENGDDLMPLFVMMKEPAILNKEVKLKIKDTLKVKCSPRHVPDLIIEVKDIPYTLSGKKMEVPAKKILLGIEIDANLNQDSVRNPEAIEFLQEYAREFRIKHLQETTRN